MEVDFSNGKPGSQANAHSSWTSSWCMGSGNMDAWEGMQTVNGNKPRSHMARAKVP